MFLLLQRKEWSQGNNLQADFAENDGDSIPPMTHVPSDSILESTPWDFIKRPKTMGIYPDTPLPT